MTAQTRIITPALPRSQSRAASGVSEEGIVAGVIGAVTVALWFLLVDALAGRPLYTPTVLGTALFYGGAGLDAPEHIAASFEPALMFTWVHVLAFVVIGGIAAQLLRLAEKDPNYGFGILLLFVGFMFGFVVIAMIFADAVLQAVTWPAILGGNVLAAAAMTAYFRRRHPDLRIFP
jgi:hypothetical protein